MSDFRDPAQKQAENKRMMLAMGLSMGVLMLWNSLFPPPVAPPTESEAVTTATTQAPPQEADEAPLQADKEIAPAPEEKIQTITLTETEERTHELGDRKRQITLSNHGAHPVSITLVDQAHNKTYREPGTDADRPVVDLAAKRADFASIAIPGLNPKTWKVAEATSEKVIYTSQTATLLLKRTWSLGEHGLDHRLEIQARAASKGIAELTLSMEDPLLGGSIFSGPPDLPRSLCHNNEELVASFASDLSDEQPQVKEPYFFGVDRNFFAIIFTGEDVENCALSLRKKAAKEGDEPTEVVVAKATRAYDLAAGETLNWNNTLYLLPKSDELLASVDPKLRDTIDFGIFKFIAQPMLWLLTFYFSLLGNYGLAIILLTFTVKLVLWPITDMSFRSMARMKEIQPELSKLREKYKADKQMLAQKQMEMFKERGVNPAGGCFPMLLQIPVWFALYSTLRVAVELYGSPFIPGWLDDLTLADPYYILPVLLGVVFFMQQKLQPQMSDNPQQQMIMKVMPVMMTVFMVALPSGLVVYILVNTVLGIAHQYYAIKRDAKPAA